jgi:beta-glucanase (GH16 family)
MEMIGPQPTHASSTVHFRQDGTQWQSRFYGVEHTFENGSRFTDWHVYGIVWDETGFTMLIDGKQTRQINFNNLNFAAYYETTDPQSPDQGPFNRDFHLILNLAVGGDMGGIGTPVDSEFPWDMEVEWVSVYTTENDPWTVTDAVPGNLLKN